MSGKSTGGLRMAIDRCKGCELCVAVCPPGVLAMTTQRNEIGYLYPELSEGCTGCTACQMICPDFVFEVYRQDRTRSDKGAAA